MKKSILFDCLADLGLRPTAMLAPRLIPISAARRARQTRGIAEHWDPVTESFGDSWVFHSYSFRQLLAFIGVLLPLVHSVDENF